LYDRSLVIEVCAADGEALRCCAHSPAWQADSFDPNCMNTNGFQTLTMRYETEIFPSVGTLWDGAGGMAVLEGTAVVNGFASNISGGGF
jgi:hypothetical protein